MTITASDLQRLRELAGSALNSPDAFTEIDFRRLATPSRVLALVERVERAQTIMQDFVDKVDRGEAKSRRTYALCKLWLSSAIGVGGEKEKNGG